MVKEVTPPTKRITDTPWSIFWVALAVRVAFMTFAHTYHFDGLQDHYQFGWEMGRIARAVARGQGYSDPFTGHTGPTAWCPPLYPLLLAGVFKLFGVYTSLSAWVILTINSIFSAATSLLVYEIGWRSFNRRVALWSAWFWALYPATMQYAIHWVWDISVTACAFSAIIVVALRCRGIGDDTDTLGSSRAKLWAVSGILWGAIGLLNPSLLSMLPAVGLWMLYGERGDFLRGLRRASLAAALCAICIFPWIARNWITFHALIPIRTNLGCELYMSSLARNDALPWGAAVSIYPNSPDMKRYKALGEIEFCRERGEMARAIFQAHPHRFRNYTLKRLWFFWGGIPRPLEKNIAVEFLRELNYCILSLSGIMGLALAVHRHQRGALLYLFAFVFMPLAYYAVTVQARFRSPLEPLICVLAAYLFETADRTRVWSWKS